MFNRLKPRRATLLGALLAASAFSFTQQSHAAATYHPGGTAVDPLPGNLLIADRGNNRLLVVTPDKRIIWSMPIPVHGPKGVHSHGADDGFFTPDHKHIIVNDEDDQTVGIISIAKKRFVWMYGHKGVKGSKPGYLNTPDDAYQLANGNVVLADIGNDRVIVINPKTNRIVQQFGTTGVRYHAPPEKLNAPNGALPTPNGNFIVTEIDWGYGHPGFIDKISSKGKLLWSFRSQTIYPSDANQMPDGNILVVGYTNPGVVDIYSPQGKLLWHYRKLYGAGALDHPSIALPLSNGNLLVCDDWDNRVVVIDPKTKKIVWQYGHKGVKGARPGYLNIPDGMDMVPAGVKFPANSSH
ncbi:PQQ-binding-like beta-propeller repeat protein [Acidihalobacter ferrooxydans]|uniref:Pyrrolo-quinoline quinone repeat domain-containing protein n=1 Tax=Acidihalobacter ferrooxydans TaxID=1765967 RepID=A0A1P8UIE1_9GAMM|nr:PQQ-binding-like beta-propeller repeat protein [Acidihalobacter ferrooxydans]APZ43598.1 hypothetical protein BW247_11280 [Acidihalobacter ferrooxydans]